jgi:hypothetical protein
LTIAIVLVPAAAHAATVSLVADHDNTLFDGNGAQDFSSGVGTSLFAGNANVGARRALLHFDLSSIPAQAVISGASLTLVDTRSAGVPALLEIHALTAAFGEGSSNSGDSGTGVSAMPGDSTWLHRIFPSTLWTTPGGDFSPVASASVDVTGEGTFTWSGAGLTADVGRWLSNPASNFGWIILDPSTTNSNAQRFSSRENSSMTNRPILTVTYTVPSSVPALNGYAGITLALALGSLGVFLVGPRRARGRGTDPATYK